jgi:hypothetical protein
MTVLPMVELPCSRPTAKNVSFCSSGALRRITSVMKCSSCKPTNSGLNTSDPPASRGSKRNAGYSSPSISWLFNRPP